MKQQLLSRLLSVLVGVSCLTQSLFSTIPAAASGKDQSVPEFPCDGQLLNVDGLNHGWIVDGYFSKYTRLNTSPSFSQMAPNGGAAVGLDLDLNGVNSSGEVFIDLKRDQPGCAGGHSEIGSLWEPESIVSVWVWAPANVRGDAKNANGLHLYVEDANGKKLYGTWQSFQENTWFEVKLRLTGKTLPCGYMDADFDITRVRKIGINVSLNIKDDNVNPIKDTIMISPVRVESGNLTPPDSKYRYTFDEQDTTLPPWEIVTDKVWHAEAFTGFDVQDGILAINADFMAAYDEDPHRKGVMNLVLVPDLDLDLSSTSQDFISLDIKFDPPPDLTGSQNCPFTLQLWAFDSGKKIQLNSINQDVGSDDWTRVAFRLGDLAPSEGQGKPEDRLDISQIGKVGFQLFAGALPFEYHGRVLIDNIAIGGARELQVKSKNTDFITVEGSHFFQKDERFRFVGANAEYLPYEPDWVLENVLDRANSMGIRVIRTWGFGEGCQDYNLPNCEDVSPYFQVEPGVYNPMAFEHFDRIVYEAGIRKIRLIVPLVNNWYEHGGIPRYVCWQQEKKGITDCDTRTMSSDMHDSFYTDSELRRWYEEYVKYFVTHVNTITGVAYADDPTILAWELINEPRAKSDPSGQRLHNWIVDMSTYLNGLAPKQLIGTGEEGWYILTKDDADLNASWQVFDKNYWHYGVNWKDASCLDTWGSNGTDFLSDNSSESRTVLWQEEVGASLSSPVDSSIRAGVPDVDFTGIHLYISPGETGLSRAPYCYYYSLDSLCASANNTTNSSDLRDLSYTGEHDPIHQAKEWILQHVTTAHQELNKPFLLEEFNFPVATRTPFGFQANTSENLFQVTPDERANLFRQYMDFSYDMDVDGVMFWNIGFDGFMQQAWIEIDALKQWKLDRGGDAAVNNVDGILLNYSPDPEYLDVSMNLSEPNVDWLRAEGNPLIVELMNDGDAQEVVFDVTFEGNPIVRSRTVAIQPGKNTFMMDDLFMPVDALHSNVACPQQKDDSPLMVNFKVTVKNYEKTGKVYFKFYTIFNNKYVIFPGDPVEDVIRLESVKWTKNNPPADPKVQIDHKVTCSDTPIHPELISDGKLPIQFSLAGSIEHPEGYYYRYYISGPKGQEKMGFGSLGFSESGTIWVDANALGKYEVKIAPEGESFARPNVGDACHFMVGNSGPIMTIDRVRVDGVDFGATYGAVDIDQDFLQTKHTFEIQISSKDDVSSELEMNCRLLWMGLDVGSGSLPCQIPLSATTRLGTEGFPASVSGDFLPGSYELQMWVSDEEGSKSEISRLYITVPLPGYVWILGIILLFIVGYVIWNAIKRSSLHLKVQK